MSATVTSVQEILGRHYDTGVSLEPFISMGELVVARVVSCATRKGITLSDDERTKLTELMAAHFYGSADQFYSARSTGRASGQFAGKTSLGLDGTLYGQNAKLLDPSGCLSAMDKGGKIQLKWLGKTPSEQIPFWERD